jgi:hypothetical protein
MSNYIRKNYRRGDGGRETRWSGEGGRGNKLIPNE